MNKITILDAAMGSELEQRGVPMHKEIWAGLAALEHSDVIQSIHEDNINNGFGAEIAGRIAEFCFEFLDAPIKRVASKDYPIPYSSILENKILVQTEWISDAINDILNY